MVVLVICKNEEDPIKTKGTKVVTRLSIDFSDAQGQLTPKSLVRSCRILNKFNISLLSLLPLRMRKI